ncbi:MAG: beta-ketoacyl-ACP synthase II [Rhabdochlamydiaceae bacterium]|nr:beta-ketoacyl-ACP synthase II [Candidatus Amphrikana amoebophyrae]
MSKRRVVVTGLGTTSCYGTDIKKFYDSLIAGKSGIRMIESFDVEQYPTRFAGEVQDFEVGDYLDKKQARRVDPFIAYAVVAGKKALEDAGFKLDELDQLDRTRCGVLVGSGMGGMKFFTEGVNTIREKGFNRLTPFFIPYIITNMAGALLSMELEFQGPNYSISTACATANHSIASALKHIRDGEADLMVCGGTEAPINDVGLAGFVACKALSTRNDEPTKASRPWDKGRDGFVMGEGAGILVLESYEHAKARGATIYGELAGAHVNGDAYHLTDPRKDGEVVGRCIENALKDGGIDKSQINYINAHATSTSVGDLCEIRALKSVFGDHLSNVWINGTKSLTGHCLGAAGGIEAIATLMSMKYGKLHPTLNLEDQEEETMGLNIVKNEAKELEITGAVSNSFGFGGHNATLVFIPCKD